jgi:C_GCAxxG_C_C family probable redox protein
MKSRVEKAAARFSNGFNCSQAVFAAFAPPMGLEEETALKIACGFGAGMAGMQNTCGAVTGAFMVIGLKRGKFRAGDDDAKERTYSLIKIFTERFKERQGSIACRDLLGCDIAEAREKNLFDSVCIKAVKDSAEILEDLL